MSHFNCTLGFSGCHFDVLRRIDGVQSVIGDLRHSLLLSQASLKVINIRFKMNHLTSKTFKQIVFHSLRAVGVGCVSRVSLSQVMVLNRKTW